MKSVQITFGNDWGSRRWGRYKFWVAPLFSTLLPCLPSVSEVRLVESYPERCPVPADHPILQVRPNTSLRGRDPYAGIPMNTSEHHGIRSICRHCGAIQVQQPQFIATEYRFDSTPNTRNTLVSTHFGNLPRPALLLTLAKSIGAFVQAAKREGVNVQILKQIIVSPTRSSCRCEIYLDAQLDFSDMTLRFKYGGCDWIMPQEIPHEVVALLQQSAKDG